MQWLLQGGGRDITKQRNTETRKQRNNETGISSNFFFLNTETHKETNSADIGSVEKFAASAKRVSRRGCLDVQSIHYISNLDENYRSVSLENIFRRR